MSNAIYGLNSYTWKLLEANLGWTLADYEGAVPIIPYSDQPELIQTGKPFLLYGYAHMKSGHLYALKRSSLFYNIKATSHTDANEIGELLFSAFERQDDAARDVNNWLKTLDDNAVSRDVSFGSICSNMLERAAPAESEGGYVSAVVGLELKYVSYTDPVTSGFTYP